MTIAHNLGFPPLGAHRELKRATEGYWSGKVPQAALLQTGAELRAAHWRLQRDAGVDLIPSNDFSYYDRVLDACAMVGAVPTRYGWSGGSFDLDTYFAMARGVQSGGRDVTAMEMTKWFDTNYHYIVPEFEPGQTFRLASTKVVDEFTEAKALGFHTKPVLIRSEEHTSELQSLTNLVCRLLLEKKKNEESHSRDANNNRNVSPPRLE